MKIKDIRVQWNAKYSNSATLEMLVEECEGIPRAKLEEEGKRGDGIYYLEVNGYVKFRYKDKDGKMWSSRDGVINKLGFGPCIDVALTEKRKTWEKGYTFIAGAVTVELVKEWMDENHPRWSLEREVKRDNEVYWVPRDRRGLKDEDRSV